MLWYKAWLETRSRFLISLFGMVALCSVFVLHGDRDAIYEVGTDYYNYVLFAGHQILVMMWALAVTLIMMGGLLREKATGSSAFTLALPVSRTRLMMVRICMGLAQAVVLAIVPWTAMFTVGSIFGKTHSRLPSRLLPGVVARRRPGVFRDGGPDFFSDKRRVHCPSG